MANKKSAATGEQIVCVNRQARHNYFIEETYEAGLDAGRQRGEVAARRQGQSQRTATRAFKKAKPSWSMLTSALTPAPTSSITSRRGRVNCFCTAREIERLTGKTKERGLTLIPLKFYFKNGRAKVEIGLGARQKALRQARNAAAQSCRARSRAVYEGKTVSLESSFELAQPDWVSGTGLTRNARLKT